MTVREIYDFCIQEGMCVDPRGPEGLRPHFERVKRDYESLSEAGKEQFEKERLTIPFGDVGVLAGDEEAEVRGMMVGINIGPAEAVVAARLRDQGHPIDALFPHHTSGQPSLISPQDALEVQADMMVEIGVPEPAALKIMARQAAGIRKGVSKGLVQVAELLGLAVINIHTPVDNHADQYVRDLVEREQPEAVGDLVALLRTIPEYEATGDEPPYAAVGSDSEPLGKMYIFLTGGWSPSVEAREAIVRAGVGTFIWPVHPSADEVSWFGERNVNVVVYPHNAADSLGLNLLLDKLIDRAGGDMEIVAVGDFARIDHRKWPPG